MNSGRLLGGVLHAAMKNHPGALGAALFPPGGHERGDQAEGDGVVPNPSVGRLSFWTVRVRPGADRLGYGLEINLSYLRTVFSNSASASVVGSARPPKCCARNASATA